MRIVEDCPKGWDCPRICATDGPALIVQGYVITDHRLLDELALAGGESAVRVSRELVDLAYGRGLDLPWIRTTTCGDVVAVGAPLTAPEILPRRLPSGERAVVTAVGHREVST